MSQAGKFREYMKLQKITRTISEGGQPLETWTELATLAGDVRPISGSEQMNSGKLTNIVSHRVYIRAFEARGTNWVIMPDMRFLWTTWLGEQRVLNIVYVAEDHTHDRRIECLCNELRQGAYGS